MNLAKSIEMLGDFMIKRAKKGTLIFNC